LQHAVWLCICFVFQHSLTQQNKIAVSSQAPILNKYKNLKHKVLKYNAKKNTQVLCKCEGWATPRQTCLGSYFLDPDDVRNLSLGAVWNFIKGQDSHDLDFGLRGCKGSVKIAYVQRARKGSNPLSIQFHSHLTFAHLLLNVWRIHYIRSNSVQVQTIAQIPWKLKNCPHFLLKPKAEDVIHSHVMQFG
jgi:hypothetical protein